MRQIATTGVVLSRINYGEADRIISVITPDHGKLRLMAKGVRKSASKLAGGIELFSISSITYIPGKRDISTLISTRLVTHYGSIVANIKRTMLGYEILKMLDKATQEQPEEEFYHLLVMALRSLGDNGTNPLITELWFRSQLLKLLGREPNLATDAEGNTLEQKKPYVFDFETMAFAPANSGKFNDRHIKLLRLLLTQPPEKLNIIRDFDLSAQEILPLLRQLNGQFM